MKCTLHRSSTFWVAIIPLIVAFLTIGTMFLIAYVISIPSAEVLCYEFTEIEEEGTAETSKAFQFFVKCRRSGTAATLCAQRSRLMPLQLLAAYDHRLSQMDYDFSTFLECAQRVYEQLPQQDRRYLTAMSDQIDNFQRQSIDFDNYCYHLFFYEQPFFCRLKQQCAKNGIEIEYLTIEYAKRYARVLLSHRRNNLMFCGISERVAYAHGCADPTQSEIVAADEDSTNLDEGRLLEFFFILLDPFNSTITTTLLSRDLCFNASSANDQ